MFFLSQIRAFLKWREVRRRQRRWLRLGEIQKDFKANAEAEVRFQDDPNLLDQVRRDKVPLERERWHLLEALGLKM